MRDARFRPDAPGAACKASEVAEWRAQVESFLAAELAADAAAGANKKVTISKWHRLATFDLVCGMDWQMKAGLGIDGWNTFASSSDFPKHRLQFRPRCSIVWDKGPDNMCATGYLLSCKKLRASFFFSAVHGAQRAMWSGVQGAGRYALLLVACAVANLDMGAMAWGRARGKAKATEGKRTS